MILKQMISIKDRVVIGHASLKFVAAQRYNIYKDYGYSVFDLNPMDLGSIFEHVKDKNNNHLMVEI